MLGCLQSAVANTAVGSSRGALFRLCLFFYDETTRLDLLQTQTAKGFTLCLSAQRWLDPVAKLRLRERDLHGRNASSALQFTLSSL